MSVEKFIQAMAQADIMTTDEIIPDGKLHRIHIEGDRIGSRNGWYVLHLDGVPAGGAGAFGSWKDGITHTWSAKLERECTPQERTAHSARTEAAKAAHAAEERQRHLNARENAARDWAAASLETGVHRYLVDKGAQSYGLRTNGKELLIQVRDTSGTVHGLQRIRPNGEKRFTEGTAVAGTISASARLANA